MLNQTQLFQKTKGAALPPAPCDAGWLAHVGFCLSPWGTPVKGDPGLQVYLEANASR